MRPNRIYSQKSQSSQLNKSHIIEAHLDRKSQLINKYQTETNDLMEQIETKQPYRKAPPMLNVDKSARKRAMSSLRKDTGELDSGPIAGVGGSLKDYNKLILGLEYALESERKKNEQLTQKNLSLQSQISNLRNLLMGPDQQKHYQKTAYKQSQDKISYLQSRIMEQKKNYEFIIDSKNESLTNLQLQIKTLRKSFEEKGSNNDQALSRRVLDLVGEMDEMKLMLTKKNIVIQRLKYQNVKDQDDSDDEEITKIRKAERMKFYLQQLEISNKLIMRKNVEILGLSNKIMSYEKIMDVMELYLDKKEVRGVDLSVLEHPCVNKLRVLLREKAVFEKQLLNQLNDHNKKIATFETEISGRQRSSTQKISQVINDNKRLVGTVTNLQSNIANLQKQLEIQRRQNEMLTTQITINKREFIQEVTKLKDELGQISSVTKNQFDRMKIENLKLSEQNRSLLFLVGEKQREIHKKGQAIKTFEEYREKINTLNVGQKQKRKIESVSEEPNTQIGTKVMMINNFSNWLFEWNKIKNWTNKKTLLNLILDKEEIRGSALESMGYLVNVVQECLLQSKNVQIQERGIMLLSYFVQHNILKNQGLYLSKVLPIVVRGFRPIIQGEQQQKCRLLNESSLKIMTQVSKTQKWMHQLTNEMLSVNGLKYLFSTIRQSQVDSLIESAYNVLIMMAKNNEMISFMLSFDLNTLIFSNLNGDYTFIIFLLTLVKYLLMGDDYLKAQSSVLGFRGIFEILGKDDDEELLELGLDCVLILMDKNSIFTKSLQKLKCISILSQILRKSNDESNQSLLKQAGKAYLNIVGQLESQNLQKYTKTQLDKLLQIVKLKKFNEFRFSRIIKVLAKLVAMVQGVEQLDEKVFLAVVKLYEHYQVIEQDIRVKCNEIVNTIFERNKELLNRYSNDTMIGQFVEAYKLSSQQEQLVFLLKILIFQGQQKRTTELLRSGRESMLSKLLSDSLQSDYNVAIASLKLLLLLSKQKYSQKFINQTIMNSLVKKVLNQRGEEEYINVTLSLLYFLCKMEGVVGMALEAGVVGKVCNVILERHDKEQLIFKSLAVLQVCHTMNYKKKVLNHLIANDNNLQILKTLNFTLRKSKSKSQLGSRAIFLYDFFNNPTSIESLAILAQRNEWLIEDLIMLRNQYIGKVDNLVYKIEMLLHEMSQRSNKVKKMYQRFRVQGDEEEDD